MRVVELVGGALGPCVERARADDEERDSVSAKTAPRSAAERDEECAELHGHLVDQKFNSRLMWNTVPLAPTG